MSWFSKKKTPIKPLVKYTCLDVVCKNNKFHGWNAPYQKGRQFHHDFIKWFHCRPQSQSYTITADKGCWNTTILREQIISYSVKVKYQ